MELKYLIIPKIKTFSKESTRKQESLRWLKRPGCYGKQEEMLMRGKFIVKGTVKWPNKIAMKIVSPEELFGEYWGYVQHRVKWVSGRGQKKFSKCNKYFGELQLWGTDGDRWRRGGSWRIHGASPTLDFVSHFDCHLDSHNSLSCQSIPFWGMCVYVCIYVCGCTSLCVNAWIH